MGALIPDIMQDHPLRCLQLNSPSDALDVLEQIGVDPYGIEAMLPKMATLNIFIKGIPCKRANIIKQEMLSLGGDAAVARGSVACSIPDTDVLLMGTVKQIHRFAEKISAQPFGLQDLSEKLKTLLSHIAGELIPLKTSRRQLILSERTLVMGILNVTPDSFSDGGRTGSATEAIAYGLQMVADGADILDIGGESSRPGAEPIPLKEELKRVIPVIKGLAKQLDIPLSVDTTKAAVAREAIACGAEIINDISALRFDKRMGEIAAETKAAVILMHMRGAPRDMQDGDLAYRSVPGDMVQFLLARIEAAVSAGIDKERISIDPGIGFGKTGKDNLKLLKHLAEFKVLGRPIVTGVSRKAFIGELTGEPPAERLGGTAAAVTAAIVHGSHVVRVHDVKAMKKVAAVADALVRA